MKSWLKKIIIITNPHCLCRSQHTIKDNSWKREIVLQSSKPLHPLCMVNFSAMATIILKDPHLQKLELSITVKKDYAKATTGDNALFVKILNNSQSYHRNQSQILVQWERNRRPSWNRNVGKIWKGKYKLFNLNAKGIKNHIHCRNMITMHTFGFIQPS